MATYRDVLGVREFRALLVAGVLSDLGDQLTRVALTVLVYRRTGSPLLSAGVFAATYLPSLLGGPVLSSLGDRYPARTVLISCDAVRAYLVVGLALVMPPVPVLLIAVLLVETCTVPFDAARACVLPEVLDGDDYVLGAGLSSAQHQVCSVVGFGVAGVVLGLFGVRGALALDAVTFAVSALLLSARVASRQPTDPEPFVSAWETVTRGLSAVRADPRVVALLMIAWVGCGVSVVPEALAATYVDVHRLPTSAVGVLLAASPCGTALGGVLVTRLVPADQRMRLLVPLLLTCSAPLLLVPAVPGLVAVVVLLALSGVGTACLLLVSTTVAREVSPAVRSRVYGIGASGLMAAQGLGVLLAGGLATAVSVDLVFAVCGWGGLALSFGAAWGWFRATAPAPIPPQRTASARRVLEVDRGVVPELRERVL